MLFLLINWAGAAALVAAPFLINYSSGKMLAMVGLALLTLQAYRLRAFNLVFLNMAGIIGYAYSIWSTTV